MPTSVIIKTALSGTIDGAEWPAVGESFILRDEEAKHLEAAGHVEIVGSTDETPEHVKDAVAEVVVDEPKKLEKAQAPKPETR